MPSRRSFLNQSCFFLSLCSARLLASCSGEAGISTSLKRQLLIGAVADGDQIAPFQELEGYLEQELGVPIDLETTPNELRAIAQIKQNAWHLIFASPGVAAIAIAEGYVPIFSLNSATHLSSVLVVRDDSAIKTLEDVNGATLALGHRGSATAYFVPLWNLYGITLNKIVFANANTALTWLEQSIVDVAAMSQAELEAYRKRSQISVRVISIDRRQQVPAGSVVISPDIDQNQQILLEKAMKQAHPNLIQGTGYVPNAPIPQYEEWIAFINQLQRIEGRIREDISPVPLY
ncbi:PhnD/SsuA/transferrin family substrate-binding protein [Oculatella sp. LEGE 06141]|uniref:phosphate/phosphite/phosphonate ABC transporter substrate-binding protein n=1 Tax=Oculatella sp. LEGE 06141 TaxID=1828648 RepID=UPI001882E5E7|nr:PhnD/SsuA/transferrin family substrate-binding protein [Oculatella sp. LEGE 06141]MBE9180202.1 PhnD/SsuA/transferrin family substrate-binding protein [Oculatella sp. LEGE 06141]